MNLYTTNDLPLTNASKPTKRQRRFDSGGSRKQKAHAIRLHSAAIHFFGAPAGGICEGIGLCAALFLIAIPHIN